MCTIIIEGVLKKHNFGTGAVPKHFVCALHLYLPMTQLNGTLGAHLQKVILSWFASNVPT